MSYTFKLSAELGWIIVTAAVLALAQVLLTFEPERITSWETWAISLLGAVTRAVAAAVIAAISGGGFETGRDR